MILEIFETNLGFWFKVQKRGFHNEFLEMFVVLEIKLSCDKIIDLILGMDFGRKMGFALNVPNIYFVSINGINVGNVKLD